MNVLWVAIHYRIPYLTNQLYAVLRSLPEWRDTFKLTDHELPLLFPLLTIQYPIFWGPSERHSSILFLGNEIYPSHGLASTYKISCGSGIWLMHWRWPTHCYLHFLMVFESTSCLVRKRIYLFVICFDHIINRIFLWLLIPKCPAWSHLFQSEFNNQ